MIYIISGFMRTGTSAMMAALIAGGMDAAWSDERDKLATAHADEHYHPNRAGLYEVPLREYGNVDFPLAYQGKLIKVMAWGLDGLAVNQEGYRVVLMRRDQEEIRQSYEAFFGRPLRHPWFSQYTERMDRAARVLANRRDVANVSVVDYAELVRAPIMVFADLQANGWSGVFNRKLAADTIDQAQYRFRRELLTAGI